MCKDQKFCETPTTPSTAKAIFRAQISPCKPAKDQNFLNSITNHWHGSEISEPQPAKDQKLPNPKISEPKGLEISEPKKDHKFLNTTS